MTIFWPLGGAAPPIIYTLENGQILLVHPPLATGVLLTTFLRWGQNWLKI